MPANERTPRGTPLRIPSAEALDGLSWAEDVAKVREEGASLIELGRRLDADRETAQRSRKRVLTQDRQTAAEALRAGRPDPGDAGVVELDETIRILDREADIAAVALRGARADLGALVAANREPWLSETMEVLAEARMDAQVTFEAFRSARMRVADLEGVARWVRHPEKHVTSVLPRLPGLPTASIGETHMLRTVLDALEADLAEADIVRLPGIFRGGDQSRPAVTIHEDGDMRRAPRGTDRSTDRHPWPDDTAEG